MKLLAFKFYLLVIVALQRFLLWVADTARKLYGPLPSKALKLRLAIKEIKK